jgi:putative lipoprotein
MLGGCASFPFGLSSPRPAPVGTDPVAQVRAPVVLQGTVTYLQRIAMHPSAVVEVRLWDLSIDAEVPRVVAEQVIRRPGEPPVAFELTLDAAAFRPDHTYTVSARILVDEAVLFATDTEYRVLTHGAPDSVQLVLARPTAEPKAP